MSDLEEALRDLRRELARLRGEEMQRGLPQLLTLERTAYELSCSPTTVKALIRKGIIVQRKIPGHHPRIPVSEILRLARADEPKARSATSRRPAKRSGRASSPAVEAEKVRAALRKPRKKTR
jgi:hypothetical protein